MKIAGPSPTRVGRVIRLGLLLLLICEAIPALAGVEWPKEVHAVFGDCEGTILLTPTKRDTTSGTIESNLLVYDCVTKAFRTMAASSHPRSFYTDFTGIGERYYFATGEFNDGVLRGEYREVTATGISITTLNRRELDTHDVILKDDLRVYMKYVPDRETLSCFNPVPLDFEVVEEDRVGKVTWSWSSKGKISRAMNVATPASMSLEPVAWWRNTFRPVRHCITVFISWIKDFELPRFTWLSRTYPTLQFNYDDYVHANSIQARLNGNIVVSARHLDAVFEVDRSKGNLTWVVVGPKSKMKGIQIDGDPLQGFSHQHAATLYEDVLLVFDNGNLFYPRPSRAVIYRMNWKDQRAEFIKQFLEPNGKPRPATGSAYIIDKKRLIVGWGYLFPEERNSAQRAVSVFDINTGKEIFGIDFAPGYDSYRAKWSPAK